MKKCGIKWQLLTGHGLTQAMSACPFRVFFISTINKIVPVSIALDANLVADKKPVSQTQKTLCLEISNVCHISIQKFSNIAWICHHYLVGSLHINTLGLNSHFLDGGLELLNIHSPNSFGQKKFLSYISLIERILL